MTGQISIDTISFSFLALEGTSASFMHCVSKKVPTFKLAVTLSNLN